MSPSTASLNAASAIGISSAAFLAGQLTSLSFLSTPVLLCAPDKLLRTQTDKINDRVLAFVTPVGVLATSALGFVAFHAHTLAPGSRATKLSIAAAAILPTIAPFSYFMISQITNAIRRKSSADEEQSTNGDNDDQGEGEVGLKERLQKPFAHQLDQLSSHQLVHRWASLNLIRAGVAAISSALAATAAFHV